ncbi:hypothetical protein DOM22_09775 [Bdellovibrio sp. ZAP7]|uniref:hypothetical protein n=1 Tax=Bdellovibrio sp. ZAP7 TaxID=2231053 RepID=UPI001158F69F|nr:hypothetical protein [Bdellovibrio sp. ZAP7]QDK45417.1 hypothetical protein DOM22_09775 [Bdellovibrio sp. ZAP7]
MKRFLATYMGSPNSSKKAEWDKLPEEQRKSLEKAGMEAWQKWGQEHHKAIVDMGAPIGKTKLANKDGISNSHNMITAFTVVEAESHEAAAKMFVNHPHFTIFPGESVEIMECLPMPTQK